jgi:glucokinase
VILAAADIGGTKLTLSLADIEGIHVKLHQPTRLRGDRGAVPRQVVELVERACRILGMDRTEVSALGVSAASPFEMRDGLRELSTLTLCGGLQRGQGSLPNDWTSIPLENELRAAFPRLRIENDCSSAVVAERLFGAGKGEDNLVYVTWSTGVGAGAYVDGHLLKGKNGNALHLGYLLRSQSGSEPATGSLAAVERTSATDRPPAFVRLESLVGGPGLQERYGKPAPALFRDSRGGQPQARRLVSWAARVFAHGLVDLTSLLDPAVIVVGGGIALRNWDVLGSLVEREYRAYYPVLTRQVRLRRSGLGEHLGDLAALSLVMPEDWVEPYRRTEPWATAAPAVSLAADD